MSKVGLFPFLLTPNTKRDGERERESFYVGLNLAVRIIELVKQILKVNNYLIWLVLNNCVRDLLPPFFSFTLSIYIY